MRLETQAVARFSCLGAECPDTCCQGWGMQVAQETVERYRAQAPDLLDAVTQGEATFVMRRDPVTDRCVKFDAGWCSIHRDYGQEFLGDACHFYPRITRALGTTVITTAALSCPEMARQTLTADDSHTLVSHGEVRTPYLLKNYLPSELSEEAALAIHSALLTLAGDASATAEHHLMQISAIAHALTMQPLSVWSDALPLYLSMVDGRIPTAEPAATDLFNLVHATYGLMLATPKPRAPLAALVAAMETQLGITFDAEGRLTLTEDATSRAATVSARMREQSAALQPMLRRYLQAQLSQALFPFSGLGNTLIERVTILGVRLATVKLALATLGTTPTPEAAIATIQTLSRFLDHLADPTLSLRIYEETGWIREPRLRALLGA